MSNDFKIGDRVEYTGKSTLFCVTRRIGERGRVTREATSAQRCVGVLSDSGEIYAALPDNLAHLTLQPLLPPEPRTNLSFADWSSDARTAALITRCVRAERERNDIAFTSQLQQQKIDTLEKKLNRARNQLARVRTAINTHESGDGS